MSIIDLALYVVLFGSCDYQKRRQTDRQVSQHILHQIQPIKITMLSLSEAIRWSQLPQSRERLRRCGLNGSIPFGVVVYPGTALIAESG